MVIHSGQVATSKRRFSQSDFNRFAALIRDNNPIHVDPVFAKQTRFGRTVAHGMFLYATISQTLSRLFTDGVMIQLFQDLMFPFPTYTDTEISVSLSVADAETDESRVDLHTRITLPDGNTACEGQMTMTRPGTMKSFGWQHPFTQHIAVSEAQTLKNLTLGQSATAKRVFSPVDLDEYALLTGDQNPLFADAGCARHFGYKDRLVPGPLLSGMFSDLLGTRLPGRGTNWLKQRLHFPLPACVGDEITARVEVTRLRPQKDLVNLWDTCTNSEGDLVCEAESLVLVEDLET